MENIHNPSVPSGTPINHESAKTGDYDKLMKLMDEKERVEKELDALGSVLQGVRLCGFSV
jgi:hypothetical protein